MSSMSSQFEDERWLAFTTTKRHRDAFIAEQIRIGRAGRSSSFVAAWTSLRASIGAKFFAADPAPLQDVRAKPANANLIA